MRRDGDRGGIQALLAVLGAFLTLVGCAAARPEGSYQADYADPAVQKVALELVSLAEHMDDPKPKEELRMGMIYSSDINAANAGGGVFYFTDGLLETGDHHLIRGVIAHELAHDDLNHVAEGVAISILVSTAFIVASIWAPGVEQLNRVANPLITRAFSRAQELEADSHAVDILERAFLADGLTSSQARQQALATLDYTLRHLRDRYGDVGGSLLASHPAVDDRIEQIASLTGVGDLQARQKLVRQYLSSLPLASVPVHLPNLTMERFRHEMTTSDDPTCILIYSRTSRYSREVLPLIGNLVIEYGDAMKFYQLEAFQASEVLGTEGPLPSPMLLLYYRGNEVGRIRGLEQMAPNETTDLRTKIDLHLSLIRSGGQAP